MRRFVRPVRPAGLLVAALLVAGCVAQSSPAPGSLAPGTPSASPIGPHPATPPPAASSPPAAPTADLGCAAIVASKSPRYPDPTLPPPPSPTIAHPDAAATTAIGGALDALAGLQSYRMSVDIVGLSPADLRRGTVDLGVRGTVTHTGGLALDALLGTRMREPDGSAAITSAAQLVAGDGYVWTTDNVSRVLEPSSGGSMTSLIALLTPEGLADRVIRPFAGGYRRAGTERHGGVEAVHYRAGTEAAEAYAAALSFPLPGSVSGDLWIAVAGGELVGARIVGTSSRRDASTGATADDGVLIAFEVTDPNSPANVVALPATPVADPIRPSGPPVDLRLEYQVMPANGISPTAADLDEIGVALRTRLDVSTRPVNVDIVGPDRLVVIVCGTTQPDADRRLIVARGAMTVVPLPAADFGTTTKAGRRALPAVGSSIDPALVPVAPAAGLGLTTAHVDPVTGRRGLTFRLGNQATDAFLAYAAGHPGEYVAVVLDGVVLACLPIEGTTAEGSFVFSGDFTEAETRLLATYLYRNPIRFELRPISDVEAPTR
jgi:hypothetical protein